MAGCVRRENGCVRRGNGSVLIGTPICAHSAISRSSKAFCAPRCPARAKPFSRSAACEPARVNGHRVEARSQRGGRGGHHGRASARRHAAVNGLLCRRLLWRQARRRRTGVSACSCSRIPARNPSAGFMPTARRQAPGRWRCWLADAVLAAQCGRATSGCFFKGGCA